MKHRFVIGVGSQRAGSTLLHQLLAESTQVFMHPLKELHYFDTKFGARPVTALKSFSRQQLKREINSIVDAVDYSFIDDRYKCYIRTNNMYANNDFKTIEYIDLFRPFLRKTNILGEVTPEYMLLSIDDLKLVRKEIGADAMIILICRDPVDRLLSAVKLMNKYNN
jgi:hypothetical protein